MNVRLDYVRLRYVTLREAKLSYVTLCYVVLYLNENIFVETTCAVVFSSHAKYKASVN